LPDQTALADTISQNRSRAPRRPSSATMGLEPRKVFVGGIPRSGVNSDDLRAHFARYGEVADAVVMMNPENGLCRGYGFVEFTDESSVLKALDQEERDKHMFAGRKVSS
jgi:RNA-binding protein Musashi